jgi:hypothetical protein
MIVGNFIYYLLHRLLMNAATRLHVAVERDGIRLSGTSNAQMKFSIAKG